MLKKVLIKGPVLSRSGYGEQARFALRALQSRPDLFDIYLVNIPWGRTGQISSVDEEADFIHQTILKTQAYVQQRGQFDISLQVTVPNEFEKIAPVNIGYTAGIETTKVSPQWIAKSNETVDKIIVVSDHSKKVFEQTKYDVKDQAGNEHKGWGLQVPVETVNYPVRMFEPEEINIEFETSKNFLVVSQWGPRKNLENTIKWFVETFADDDVGLVVKTNTASDSVLDREFTQKRLEALLKACGPRKCSVYLIHGEMSPGNLAWLYEHPTMKAMINIGHGEGYGLPLFEAAYHGLPLITTTWSGQMDFICKPNKKGKQVPRIAKVDYDIEHVQKVAVWDGVIQADSKWAFAKENSYKRTLVDVLERQDYWKKEAQILKNHIHKNFSKETLYNNFLNCFGVKPIEKTEYVFVSDMFASEYTGGAELSLQALIDSCPGSKTLLNSANLTEAHMDYHSGATWVFGNIAQISDETLLLRVAEKGIRYHFLEFDYKFCEYRNPELYKMLEDEECDYSSTRRGETITKFVNKSVMTYFMSEKQLQLYKTSLKDLEGSNLMVLSSIFGDEFFNKIYSLRNKKQDKNNKYLVLGSRSWVKGFKQSENWCKSNQIEYDVINNLSHEQVLEKLASAKGICFKPSGLDTCPRYVIEAKLLGCELELNENVQHLDEKWFKTENVDEILTYLKGRRTVFWETVTSV